MTTHLTGFWWRSVPIPGLLPREILVLRAWLELHNKEYDNFDFNVRVGTGVDPGPAYADDVRRDAILNSQKRIDAVAYKPNSVTLIEVKERVGAGALGQLLLYHHLYPPSFQYSGPVLMLAVGNTVSPDVLPVLDKNGITLQLVQVDFSVLSPRSK